MWAWPYAPLLLPLISLCLAITVRACSSLLCLSPGGWALNMKDLKLLQIIGKGEFGGQLGALLVLPSLVLGRGWGSSWRWGMLS